MSPCFNLLFALTMITLIEAVLMIVKNCMTSADDDWLLCFCLKRKAMRFMAKRVCVNEDFGLLETTVK